MRSQVWFIAFLAFVGKYQWLAKFEIENEGLETVITSHHECGVKWSNWLRSSIDETLRTTFGIMAEFEVSKGFVVAKFAN